jgi:transposase
MRQQLRDKQWKQIEGLLPGKEGDRGRRGADNRLFVEAVLWIARTGRPWRDLPAEFGLWNTAYQRYARWSRAGIWHEVFAGLIDEPRFREVFVDAPIVQAHLRPKRSVVRKKG